MFDAKKATKIKKMIKYNDGGFELGCFNFDIVYRNGKENILADSFPRLSCAAMSIDKLMEFHKALCYPECTIIIKQKTYQRHWMKYVKS